MSPRDAVPIRASREARKLSSPPRHTAHGPNHPMPMPLPSGSCLCCPARSRPKRRNSAGGNPQCADTAGDNGGTRSGRTTCSAVFPADPDCTANNAPDQPRRNLTSNSNWTTTSRYHCSATCRSVRNSQNRVSISLDTTSVRRHPIRREYMVPAPPMRNRSTLASALISASWAFGKMPSRATR